MKKLTVFFRFYFPFEWGTFVLSFLNFSWIIWFRE